jgi:hypothetical protein
MDLTRPTCDNEEPNALLKKALMSIGIKFAINLPTKAVWLDIWTKYHYHSDGKNTNMI